MPHLGLNIIFDLSHREWQCYTTFSYLVVTLNTLYTLVAYTDHAGITEHILDIFKYLFRGRLCIDLADKPHLLIVLYNRQGVVEVRVEPLLEAVEVVVRSPAAGGAAAQAALDAQLLRALEEQDEQELGLVGHDALPAVQVVLVAREAVHQEALPARLLHRLVDERARHLHRHDLPVADLLLDHLPELRPGPLPLLAQQVPRRQVHEPVLLGNERALRALAGARRSQDEHYFRHHFVEIRR